MLVLEVLEWSFIRDLVTRDGTRHDLPPSHRV